MTAAEAERLHELEDQVTKIRIRNIRLGTAFAEFLIALLIREAVRRLLD